MNAKTIFTFSGGVVAGLIIGIWLFSGGSSTPSGTAQAPVAPVGNQVDKLKLQQEIGQLEQLVKSDPENYQAWKSMGDKYFDVGNPPKSIASYRKALALDESDPNVWTDLGVMYRRNGDFTKALECFDKAIERGPSHTVSRLNKGIVYIYDLQEYAKGAAAWEDFLKLQPTGAQADDIRRKLEQLAREQGVQLGSQPAGEGDPATYFPKPDQP